MKKVVVVGSINMDLVTRCKRAPKGGETLFGEEFFQVPGGKGANQAVAIGKLGTGYNAWKSGKGFLWKRFNQLYEREWSRY